MIKLISSDMDGTLLDSYRQITPINVEAIKRAQENGINFIINTGREYPNARGLVETAGLKCDLICSNGASFTISEMEVFWNPFSVNSWYAVFKRASCFFFLFNSTFFIVISPFIFFSITKK